MPYGLSLEPVAPGVFVARGRHELFNRDNGGHISNLSAVIGNDAVAVIDTGGSAGCGRAFAAALRAVTDRPIRYVINTHMHPDHVFGNAAFAAPETTFVGHSKLPRALAARGDRYLSANLDDLGPDAFEGTRIIAASELVETTRTLDLGGRLITLRAHKTAHTDNDLSVVDQSTGTLFLGDLLFSGHVPTIDGSIKGWLSVLAELRKDAHHRVVPGHGPASMTWPEALDPLTRYLDTVARDVRALIKAGKSLGEASKHAAMTEKDLWLLFDDFHARNISTAFAELEWE